MNNKIPDNTSNYDPIDRPCFGEGGIKRTSGCVKFFCLPRNDSANNLQRYEQGQKICRENSMELLDVSHENITIVQKVMEEYAPEEYGPNCWTEKYGEIINNLTGFKLCLKQVQ